MWGGFFQIPQGVKEKDLLLCLLTKKEKWNILIIIVILSSKANVCVMLYLNCFAALGKKSFILRQLSS